MAADGERVTGIVLVLDVDPAVPIVVPKSEIYYLICYRINMSEIKWEDRFD